jgi:hypothetical protein
MPLPCSTKSATPKEWINALSFRLYPDNLRSHSDSKCDAYAPEVGYDDTNPCLGLGFQYDAQRLAKAGMTWHDAQATQHSKAYAAADLRERDVLIITHSLMPVLLYKAIEMLSFILGRLRRLAA